MKRYILGHLHPDGDIKSEDLAIYDFRSDFDDVTCKPVVGRRHS